MESIVWYNLNKGYISDGNNISLTQYPGVYVYRLKLNKNKIYTGSAVNIAQRFRQHRYKCYVYTKNNNKLYNLVQKYGWDNIEYGILEKINLSNKDIFLDKKLLLVKEQYYLDKYSPVLSINRLAG